MINLARVVRKVSNKNLANANKNKKFNKWFIAGIITGVVVAIAVAIILWVTLGDDKEEAKVDYFDTYSLVEGDKTTEVEFTKANYNALVNMMNDNYPGYVDGIIIVLAYNSESFAPEFNKNNEPDNEEAKLLKYMADLQVLVNEAKAAGQKVELYIVDITVSESDWAIMSDSSFGGTSSVTAENLALVQPLFAVIDNTAEEKLDKKCSKTTLSTILSTGIKNAEALIENLMK
jgi:hypothetical protein